MKSPSTLSASSPTLTSRETGSRAYDSTSRTLATGRSSSLASSSSVPSRLAQVVGGEQARFDPLAQLDLLQGGEQRDLADLLEVGTDEVGGRGRGVEGVRLPDVLLLDVFHVRCGHLRASGVSRSHPVQ